MRVIPTLSSTGHAVPVPERIMKIISYYLALNYSQTTRYRGNVHSIQYAAFKAGDDVDKLAAGIKLDLGKILERNFPEGMTIEVEAVQMDGTETYDIRIDAAVVEYGVRYSVGKEISGIIDAIAKITSN